MLGKGVVEQRMNITTPCTDVQWGGGGLKGLQQIESYCRRRRHCHCHYWRWVPSLLLGGATRLRAYFTTFYANKASITKTDTDMSTTIEVGSFER